MSHKRHRYGDAQLAGLYDELKELNEKIAPYEKRTHEVRRLIKERKDEIKGWIEVLVNTKNRRVVFHNINCPRIDLEDDEETLYLIAENKTVYRPFAYGLPPDPYVVNQYKCPQCRTQIEITVRRGG